MPVDVSQLACFGKIRGVRGWNGPHVALSALAAQIGGAANVGTLKAAGWPEATAKELARQITDCKGSVRALTNLGLTEQLATNICRAIEGKHV